MLPTCAVCHLTVQATRLGSMRNGKSAEGSRLCGRGACPVRSCALKGRTDSFRSVRQGPGRKRVPRAKLDRFSLLKKPGPISGAGRCARMSAWSSSSTVLWQCRYRPILSRTTDRARIRRQGSCDKCNALAESANWLVGGF